MITSSAKLRFAFVRLADLMRQNRSAFKVSYELAAICFYIFQFIAPFHAVYRLMSDSNQIDSSNMCEYVDVSREDVTLSDHLIRTASHDLVYRLNWNIPLRDLLPCPNVILSVGSVDVTNIGLSVRSTNCLDTAGICSVDDLLLQDIDYLMSVPNMGVRSVWNIIERLHHILADWTDAEIKEALDLQAESQGAARDSASVKIADEPSDCTDALSAVDWDKPLREMFRGTNADFPDSGVSVSSLRLSARAAHCFDKHGVSTIAQVLAFTVRDLVAFKSLGTGTACDILSSVRKWCSRRSLLPCAADDSAAEPAGVTNCEPTVRTQDVLDDLPTTVATVFFDLAVAALTNRDRELLSELGVASLAGLCAATSAQRRPLAAKIGPLLAAARETLLAQPSLDDLAELQSCYFRLIFQRDLPPDTRVSPDSSWLRIRISSILSGKPASARAYFARMNDRTLDEIGGLLGVTRERARQMVKRAEDALEVHPGFVRDAIGHARDIVAQFGGCIGCSELEAALWGKPWLDVPLPHTRFVSYLAGRPDWEVAGLVNTGSHVIIATLWEPVSGVIRRVGVAVAQGVADDRPGPSLWSSPLSLVLRETANVVNDELYDGRPQVAISPQAFTLAMADRDALLKTEQGRAYSSLYWTLLFGSALHQVEAILQASGRAMHHSEISDEFQRWSRRGSRIDGTLERSPVILLWGRGSYIHRDLVTVPYPLLNKIAAWIDARLATGVPFFSVARPFDEFRDECEASDIPSRQALYSTLKLALSDRYQLNEYPYIAYQSSEQSRPPVQLLIEEYVRSEGAFVSRRSITDYVSHELGVDSRLVPMYTGLAPNVLSGHSGVIHTENLSINEGAVEELIQAAVSGLGHNPQMTVSELLKTKRVVCARLGTNDARLIHSVMLSRADGRLFGRYPHFVAGDGASDIKSVAGLGAEFIRQLNGPCSLSELKAHFVEGLGLSENSVYMVTGHDRIVRYSLGALIHLDAIGWDIDKQSRLDELAQREYDQAVERSQLFSTVSTLLERWEESLPNLGEYVWTETLTSQLLRRTRRWLFLGNANNAYLPTDNASGIGSLDDFVAEYLTRSYSGAARLADFEEDLRASGIICKSLTQLMLGEQSATVIDGGDILLRRHCHAK